MTMTKQKILTADDLLRLSGKGVRGELIMGVLYETMPTGGEHGEIVMNFGGLLLRDFVRPLRLGRITGSDSGVLLERDPDTVREPDIAFFSAQRLPLDVKVRGYYEIVPDLVVEIASPNDSRREVLAKVQMWLSYGVRLVWAVFPITRIIEAHPQHGATVTLTENDTLDGGDVLPGFICKVSDIFDF